mmetsp:Transcript_58922/g.131826  ORF Transcript_58922/g.131826 Transcript_58922/m.131826 type:complete len:83 (+) Transcript_58922:423-671(+)
MARQVLWCSWLSFLTGLEDMVVSATSQIAMSFQGAWMQAAQGGGFVAARFIWWRSLHIGWPFLGLTRLSHGLTQLGQNMGII